MNKEIYNILLNPYMTNKVYDMSEKSSFVAFKVLKDATKYEIKKSVESIFEVKVSFVRTLRIKGKSRVFNRVKGKKSDFKKLMSSLKKAII